MGPIAEMLFAALDMPLQSCCPAEWNCDRQFENYLPTQDAAQDYLPQFHRFNWHVHCNSQDVPPKSIACGESMSRSASKSATYLQIWGALEVSTHHGTNPCFKAWSTLALFDYFQNGTSVSTEREPDSSGDSNQGKIDQGKEAVRAELQELLRRVYTESWKARIQR